jgi:hypothetical protein
MAEVVRVREVSGFEYSFLTYEKREGIHYFEESWGRLPKDPLMAILSLAMKVRDVVGSRDFEKRNYVVRLYVKEEIPKEARDYASKFRIEIVKV